MALSALLGKKLSMTQVWDDSGNVVPVTVLQIGPCQVVQVKTADGKDGYDAVQLGYDPIPARKGGAGDPRANKPTRGHFARHGAEAHRTIKEVRLASGETAPEAGSVLKVGDVFEGVSVVDVVGTSKGRGFAGCIKRHNFTTGPKTHGSKNYREPGSTGAGTSPGHVTKGKRMPGHMGAVRKTVRNLQVVKIEAEHNLLYVKGAVPGPRGGTILVRKARSPRN
ncbi:MAG: 50S ribosomal protein L3 [Planctomycetes bacterium]|nr:50S ribosomal protein L3 [Planctomycetota bacterium]